MNVDKIASLVHIVNNKSNDEINSNESTDLVDHDQANNIYIVAHSPTIPNKKYYLPLKRARKVSKGKNPAQSNNMQQTITTDIISIQSDDDSQDLQTNNMLIDTGLPDSQPDAINDQSEGNDRSTIVNSKKDRPRTLPDFMTKKRPRYILGIYYIFFF